MVKGPGPGTGVLDVTTLESTRTRLSWREAGLGGHTGDVSLRGVGKDRRVGWSASRHLGLTGDTWSRPCDLRPLREGLPEPVS